MTMVEYKDVDVLAAATARVALVFDAFRRIVVSVSSGKDSSVLYSLALAEACRRGREVEVFFLDQEAEYQSSIDIMEGMMFAEGVIPKWYQVPADMTNATSHDEYFLHAWEEGVEWMRDKHPMSIHSISEPYPPRFYKFFPWQEERASEPTAFLVGLRSKESLTRFRAVTKNAGYRSVSWSTKTKNPLAWRFYPIYDWTFGDVWKYIRDEGIAYNRVYDWMFAKRGVNMSSMRVSNLIHEKSFYALADLQEFEPDTYDRLVKRLGGVHCAALYAKDEFVFNTSALPKRFDTWREYRDYLVETTPIDKVERYRKRFAKQATNEITCRMQCKQVLCNDWEGSLPVRKAMSEEVRRTWWERL
jgi:predicted phosphoadenosine phosphosulfate sulfurtransferase